MQYALGIHIGCTHTCAAVRTLRGGTWSEPAPAQLGADTAAAPSALHLDDDGYFLTGDLARDAGALVPERLITGFHQRIGDDVPIVVAGEPFTPASLSAVIVGWIVEQVAADRGLAARRVTLTHPADWGIYRRQLLDDALQEAGLTDIGLIAAPLAAIHGDPTAHPADGSVFGVCEPDSGIALVGTSAMGDSQVLAHDRTLLAEGSNADVDRLFELARRSAIDPRRIRGVLLCGDPALFPLPAPRFSCPLLVTPEPELTVALGAATLASTPAANTIETTLLPKVPLEPETAHRPPRPPVVITPFTIPVKKHVRILQRYRPGYRPALTKAAVIVFAVAGMLLAFEGKVGTGDVDPGSATPQAACSAPLSPGQSPVAAKDRRDC